MNFELLSAFVVGALASAFALWLIRDYGPSLSSTSSFSFQNSPGAIVLHLRDFILHKILVVAWNSRAVSTYNFLPPRTRASPIFVQYRVLHQKLVCASILHTFRETSTLPMNLIQKFSISQEELLQAFEELLDEEYSEVLQWILENRKSDEALAVLFRKRNVVRYVREQQKAREKPATGSVTRTEEGVSPPFGLSYAEYMDAKADEYRLNVLAKELRIGLFSPEVMKVYCDQVSDLERKWFEGTQLKEEYLSEIGNLKARFEEPLSRMLRSRDLIWLRGRLSDLEELVGREDSIGTFANIRKVRREQRNRPTS